MHQPGHRVSLKEVATLAKVSVSTASQALRDSGRIAPATRARVAAAAQQLGYLRDPVLAQLASKKFRPAPSPPHSVVALLPPRRAWSFPMLRWVDACRALCQGQGLNLSVSDASSCTPSAETVARWRAEGVRGLLIGNSPHHLAFSRFPWTGLAVVCCGGYHLRACHPTVKLDVAQGLVELARIAQDRGGRRIGFAMMRHADPITDDWVRLGLARELAAACPDPIPIYSGSLSDAAGFTDWVQVHRPDTVIGFPQIFGYWLNQMGAPVGGMRRLYLPCAPGDAVSGWVEDPSAIAQEALRQLFHAIRCGVESPPASPPITLLQGVWNEGETCPPR